MKYIAMDWVDQERTLQLDILLLKCIKGGKFGYDSYCVTKGFLVEELGVKLNSILDVFMREVGLNSMKGFSDDVRNGEVFDGEEGDDSNDQRCLQEGIDRLRRFGFIKTRMRQNGLAWKRYIMVTRLGRGLLEVSDFLKGLTYLELIAFDEIFNSYEPFLLWAKPSTNRIVCEGVYSDSDPMFEGVREKFAKLLCDRLSCFEGNLDRVMISVQRLITNELLNVKAWVGVGGKVKYCQYEVCISSRGWFLGQALEVLGDFRITLPAVA